MRRRRRELAIGTFGTLALGVLTGAGACGGGGGGPKPHVDGGAPDVPDLGSVVTGTSLLVGDLDITGITTDDVAAVLQQGRGALAVPLSGTGAQPIDPDAELVRGMGSVLFAYHDLDVLDAVGDLTIWTTAKGAVPFGTGATTYLLAVSEDGTRILATGMTQSDATATNLLLGGIDGTPPATLFAVALDGGCRPVLVFTAGTFVASHCAPGSSTVTISAIDPVSGAVTDLLAQARNAIWVVPGDGGLLLLVDMSGNASLVPVAGGAGTPIGSHVDACAVAPDGSAVFLSSGGQVTRVPVGGGAAVPLAPANAVYLWGVSPDGQELLFQTVEGLTAGFGDLWLTSATASGPLTQLSTDMDTTIFDEAFTADGSQVLYFTGSDLHGVGTFTTAAVAGAAPIVRGAGGWTVRGYAGARVVYTDQYTPVAKRPGRAVLRTLDLSTGDPPTVVATHAGAYFYLSQARDRVAFSFNDGSAQSGLYVAPLP